MNKETTKSGTTLSFIIVAIVIGIPLFIFLGPLALAVMIAIMLVQLIKALTKK